MSDVHTPTIGHPVPARKSKVIADTASHTGQWTLVQVVQEATIAGITAPLKENGSSYVGDVLPAGFQINGPVTQIQLTSGEVEAHESY